MSEKLQWTSYMAVVSQLHYKTPINHHKRVHIQCVYACKSYFTVSMRYVYWHWSILNTRVKGCASLQTIFFLPILSQ